jgi:hypothetical protein
MVAMDDVLVPRLPKSPFAPVSLQKPLLSPEQKRLEYLPQSQVGCIRGLLQQPLAYGLPPSRLPCKEQRWVTLVF